MALCLTCWLVLAGLFQPHPPRLSKHLWLHAQPLGRMKARTAPVAALLMLVTPVRRTNASCALNIQPCLYNNVVYTTGMPLLVWSQLPHANGTDMPVSSLTVHLGAVDIVKDMNFTALSFSNFFDGYVGCPANNLVRLAPTAGLSHP